MRLSLCGARRLVKTRDSGTGAAHDNDVAAVFRDAASPSGNWRFCAPQLSAGSGAHHPMAARSTPVSQATLTQVALGGSRVIGGAEDRHGQIVATCVERRLGMRPPVASFRDPIRAAAASAW